jgi:hypothetical protein
METRRILYSKRPEMSHEDRQMKEINAHTYYLREIAYNGGSYKDIVAYWNKKISPKVNLHAAEYWYSGAALEWQEELFDEINDILYEVANRKT